MSVFMYDVCYGFFILICNSAFATNSSYCGLKGCCTNYRMVDGLCIACPKGTFGDDCSKECPTDKYGELCSNECHCRPTEPCDPIHGCINTEGTCNINGSEVQCCTNYILINGRCEESRNQPKVLIIIISIIPGGLLLACTVCVYIWWKRKKTNRRNYGDIQHIYSHTSEFCGNSGNNVSNNTNTTDKKTINANGNSKTFEDADSLVKGSCDEENETGTYSKLTLRLNYYEEPVRHNPLAKSYSDTPTLPIGPSEHSDTKIHSQPKFKRISSLRTVKSTTELDSWNLGDIPSGICAKDASKTTSNHTQSLEDCSNVYDLASKEDKNYKGVPVRQDFLKELTTQLMHLKKY
ncbi:uncharacterized protein LOC111132296 isoform X3 [Crassostrea virginica]